MKLGIVVGHNNKARGATRVLDGVPEWDWNKDLANRIRMHAPREVEIFYRPPGRGGIQAAYAQADDWGADLTIELHFNSSSKASATGTETLSSGSPGSMRLCATIQDKMVSALGLRDRGIKIRTPNGKTALKRRGSASLFAGRAPAALIEPYFGSNTDDCRRADERKDALAYALIEAAREAM